MSSKFIVRILNQQVKRMSTHGHGHGHAVRTTLNDLPSPSGNWSTHYDANQRKYNAQLAAGVALLVGTLVAGKSLGLLEFYNDYPKKPAVIETYK